MTFPPPRTRFVGRTDDLARLDDVLREGARLVTLWGPPGIGKTRLAIELCRRARVEAWFCDLSTARDASDACALALRALCPTPPPGPATPSLVASVLAGLPPGLLVLDNFEHLVADAASTVSAWLDAAPHVVFLVTSRARLRLAGETAHEVQPLADALELFLDRVRASSAGAADALDRDALVRVLRHLDGIPLAIELAAARLDVLGLEGLSTRLASPLDVLDCGPRDASSSHATLRNAIGASYRLLDPTERRVFEACAVFSGSFSLDAAEAVVRTDPEGRILDALQTLRDCSLLRSSSDGGRARFAFFASIRAYALEKLGTGAMAEVRARHARYYLDAARAPEPSDVADVADALAFVLGGEGDVDPSRLADAVEVTSALDPSVVPDALVDLLGRALDRADACALGGPLRARGRRTRSRALALRGRPDDARAELESAIRLAEGDHALEASLWTDLGVLHHGCREMERARACYETALAMHDDEIARARCVGNLGAVDHDLRSWDTAHDHYHRALSSFRAAGDRKLEGVFSANLALLFQERGAMGRARVMYELALDRLAQTDERRLEAITRTNLGLLCHELGRIEEARAHHEQALAALHPLVDPRSEALCLGRLAMALAALGQRDAAVMRCRRAEQLLLRLDDRVAAGVHLLHRAFVDLTGDHGPELARDRLTEARAFTVAPGVSLVDVSDDARSAVRLIEAALSDRRSDRDVLVVGPGATWFAAPGEPIQDLRCRNVLRRLLLRLVEHHRDAPGEGLTIDALREAGWPEERALPAAALNRVHVALTELRRRGLRRWLMRKDARYLIDPALRIELGEAAN